MLSLHLLRQTSDVEFLFGLDMLKRHLCVIDLKKGELALGSAGTTVPFLSEKDLPLSARETRVSAGVLFLSRFILDIFLSYYISICCDFAEGDWLVIVPHCCLMRFDWLPRLLYFASCFLLLFL